jgi:heme exporter protein B
MISETTERGKQQETVVQSQPLAADTGFMAAVWAILWKDLRIERHTRQLISIMLIFSITAVFVFNFALGSATFSPNSAAAGDAAMGFLWATILLAGTLGLNRSLSTEQENRSLDAMLLAPIDRSAIYLGKVLSITIFTLVVEAILIPIFITFFNKPFWRPQVLGVILLGTIGYVAAGVLVTSMSTQTRLREVLLPVLLLPLALPLLLAAGTATAVLMRPELPAWSEIQFPLTLVIVYDICMFIVGLLTYQYIVEE